MSRLHIKVDENGKFNMIKASDDSNIFESNFFSSVSFSFSEVMNSTDVSTVSKYKIVMLGINNPKHKCTSKKSDKIFFTQFYFQQYTNYLKVLKEIVFNEVIF